MSTISWMNVVLSIEQIFRDMLSDCNIFRCALPGEVAEQRAYCNASDPHAIFLQIVQGEINRFQDTYVKMVLCEFHDQQNYLPTQNLSGLWMQEKAMVIQDTLNRGDSTYAYLFPMYDYKRLLPVSTYETFLEDGDVSNVSALLTGNPVKVQGTGFIVRAGHERPQWTFTENPMKFQWTVIFQHWSPDVWCAQRG